MKPTMNDLENAILSLLQNATTARGYPDNYKIVRVSDLEVLQAEANIHFREPDAKQIEYV